MTSIDLSNVSMDCIGAGGQASVFSVILKGEKVAAKRYDKDCNLKEIEMMRNLQHPNIVKFLGLGIKDERTLVMMEFCPCSLRNKLQSSVDVESSFTEEALNKKDFSTWVHGITLGVEYLHNNGIVHRDLKPENVLISIDNTAKLCDFGLAKKGSGKESRMTKQGTVEWMAPELIRGEGSNKVDVWALGVIVWEMMSRVIPYEQFDRDVLSFAIERGTVRLPMPETDPHYSIESLANLLNQCWVIKPEDRPLISDIRKIVEVLIEEIEEMKEMTWSVECSRWSEAAKDRNWIIAVNKELATAEQLLKEADQLQKQKAKIDRVVKNRERRNNEKMDDVRRKLDKMQRPRGMSDKEWKWITRRLKSNDDPANLRAIFAATAEELELLRHSDPSYHNFITQNILPRR